MEEDGEPSTPFWLQSSTDPRHRRRSFSFFLNSGWLIFILCVTALVFLFFVVPSIQPLTIQVSRPNLVKKSWDSVNIVLVLIALVFGFLSRIRNYDTNFDEGRRNVSTSVGNEIQKSNPSTPHQWYDYPEADRAMYDSPAAGGLRRNCSSYPDLREASPWVAVDDRWRFSDDTQVDAYPYSESDQLRRRRSWKPVEEEEGGGSGRSKAIHVDTLGTLAEEVLSTPPPPSSPPTPSPPRTVPIVHRKPKRTYESTANFEKRHIQVENESEPTEFLMSQTVPPPIISERRSSQSDRKRGGANASKDFLSSLYNQRRKKKKQRQKSVEDFETLIQPEAHCLNSVPPPPPPPPPPSSFPNFFTSQKSKGKKIMYIPPAPPFITAARASKIAAQIAPIAAREPPLPVKISKFNSAPDNSNSEGESPTTVRYSQLTPIPTPPPPPPFKMPNWKFVVKGDYVRIGSMNSSRSGSPDLDDVECQASDVPAESGCIATSLGCIEVAAPLFCPSPDVDSKADMFIAKFRAGLKLQKMNSLKQKQGPRLSNLGPQAKPGPGPR